MSARILTSAFILACVLGVSGCASSPRVTAPSAPEPGPTELQFSVTFSNQDGDYTVRLVEYADASGTVHTVPFTRPLWKKTLTLERGDRIYVRAVADFDAVLTGSAQVVGDAYYADDRAERVDGPGTEEVLIDDVVK